MSKQTGNGCPFTKRADSKQLTVRVLEDNLLKKYSTVSHPQLQKMESSTRDVDNSSDGASESSLLELCMKWQIIRMKQRIMKIPQ